MGGGNVLKYGCWRASWAEILSPGTSFNIFWARSSVLLGSWLSLSDTEQQRLAQLHPPFDLSPVPDRPIVADNMAALTG